MDRTKFWQARVPAALLAAVLGVLALLSGPLPAKADESERPVIWVTDQMLDDMRAHVSAGVQPYERAWDLTQAKADAALSKTYVPYGGTTHTEYFQEGRAQAQTVRNLALAYHVTGDDAYAAKAREILGLWAADANTHVADSAPVATGLVIGRVMSIFADGYALVWDTMSESERDAVEQWMLAMVDPILASQQLWESGSSACCDAPWMDQQYFNNHLSAQNMGIAAIGFATRDRELIDYALDSPDNPRNLETLIRGVIFMPADLGSGSTEDIWKNDPTRTDGAPAAVPGEIYDRYRILEGHGLHYTALSLRLLTLTAEMALNNGEGDYFAYVGPNGENLERSFEFYSAFFITGTSAARTGYYEGETVDWSALAVWEIAARHYDSPEIIEALEVNDRVVNDYETFGWTAVLTHGVDGLEDRSESVHPQWTFAGADDLLGWTVRNATATPSADGLVLDIPGGDPGIVSPSGLTVDAASTQYVYIRMRNEGTTGSAQVFFSTEAAPGFSGSKVVGFPVVADGEFHDYLVDMSANSAWDGTIDQLRIDPAPAGPGTVVIESVALVPGWSTETTHEADDVVMSDGRLFTSLWWTRGEVPGSSPYGAWAEIGITAECGSATTAWTDSQVFLGGTAVVHDGAIWEARWWTRNQEPSDSPGGPWELVGTCPAP